MGEFKPYKCRYCGIMHNHNTECEVFKENARKRMEGKKLSQDTKDNIGKANSGKLRTQAFKDNVGDFWRGKKRSKKTKKKMSDAKLGNDFGKYGKGKTKNRPRGLEYNISDETRTVLIENGKNTSARWNEPEFKKMVVKGMKEAQARPEVKEKKIKASKDNWKKEGYGENIFKKLKVRPSKPEKKLIGLFKERYDNYWEYVGDGKLWIDGKNPDFVHKESGKVVKVIEYNGYSLTHTPERDKAKTKHYKRKGIGVLNIYPKELRDDVDSRTDLLLRVDRFMLNSDYEAIEQRVNENMKFVKDMTKKVNKLAVKSMMND